MVTFDKAVGSLIPSSSSMAHMKAILGALAQSKAGQKTDLGSVFHTMAEQIRRRSLILIVSDLFDRPENILRGLRHFRHRRHDVIVFHVLDEYELTFPFQRMTLFEGLEEYPKLLVDPRSLRRAYLEEIGKFCDELRRGCIQNRIDYCLLRTDRQLDVDLTRYLAQRLATKWKAG